MLPQHSAAIRHPIWFALSGTIICFSTGQWPNTLPGCVRAIWPRRRVMECCIRSSGLHNHPSSTKLRWFGIGRITEWRKSSQQVLSICGNSKTVRKAFQVKLVERMPRVYKLSRQKVAIWSISNIKYIDLFNTFLFTTWFPMCYFIVKMSSLLFYNVENSKNEEKPLNE